MSPNVVRRLFQGFLLVAAAGFLGAVIAIGYRTDARMPKMFWPFAFLPGLIGMANYIVTQRESIAEQGESLKKLFAACGDTADPSSYHPSFVHSTAAAMLLSAVFCVIAVADPRVVPALFYAGFGAYISTLWFLLVRLNANALSPRFLVNSAVKAAIAMLIAYIVSEVSGLGMPDKSSMGANAIKAVNGLYFLIGLFHHLAMKRLRITALATFGINATATADYPVRLLEGVDDGATDVLEELGITSVQHLATIPASEVCARTLYPRERVLDWLDQSILAVHCNGRIDDLRAFGIRSARSLILLCDLSKKDDALGHAACERFKQAAQRLGLSEGGLHLLSKCVGNDPAFGNLTNVYDGMPARSSSAPEPSLVVMNTYSPSPVPSSGESLGIGSPQM